MIITDESIQQFAEELTLEERSVNTIKKYARDVRAFARFAGKRDIDKFLVLEYKKYIAGLYKVTSVNTMIAAMNHYFKNNDSEELCVKQLKVQRTLYCEEDEELTKEEYVRLVKTAELEGKERLSVLMQTICATGIRASEVKYFTVEEVGRGKVVVKNKGKIRVVFLPNVLQDLLLDYAKRNHILSGSIIITKNGKPLCRDQIWREMKSVADKAGIDEKKVYPHNLRHLFARSFYEIEKDIVKLADVLGHSNINTTRIYTMSSGTEHRKYLNQMELVVDR